MRSCKFLVLCSCLQLTLAWLPTVPLDSRAAEPAAVATAFPDQWRAELRRDAIAAGVSASLFDHLFATAAPLQRVLELDRRQPEFTLTLARYLAPITSAQKVARGREMLQRHQAILGEIERRYQVEPTILVALWGIETDYGRVTGSFPVVDALATLAWDQRRSAFFRRELLAALQMLNNNSLPRRQCKGSWAGALGGLQFLPTVLQRYGVDFDGDGTIDPWHNPGDLFASGANYLRQSGWRHGEPWGQPVQLTTQLPHNRTTHRLSQWRQLGVRPMAGRHLPAADRTATLIFPEDDQPWLVYANFEALLTWNRSDFFAIAAGTLADLIQKGKYLHPN